MTTEKIATPESLLKTFFERKALENPRYSLRALARDLKVSPTYLSKIFSGKKKIPLKRAEDFISMLRLDEKEASQFKLSVLKSKLGPIGGEVLEDCLKKMGKIQVFI